MVYMFVLYLTFFFIIISKETLDQVRIKMRLSCFELRVYNKILIIRRQKQNCAQVYSQFTSQHDWQNSFSVDLLKICCADNVSHHC